MLTVTSGTIGGSYYLKASTSLGSAVAPTTFSLYGGTLGCTYPTNIVGDLDPNLDAAYTQKKLQGKWGLIRGNNKEGGDPCLDVPYTFTLNVGDPFANPPEIISPQTASFIVPTSPPFGTQKVAVQYVVVWGRVAVNTAALADKGWTAKRPKLSWGFASPTPEYGPVRSGAGVRAGSAGGRAGCDRFHVLRGRLHQHSLHC